MASFERSKPALVSSSRVPEPLTLSKLMLLIDPTAFTDEQKTSLMGVWTILESVRGRSVLLASGTRYLNIRHRSLTLIMPVSVLLHADSAERGRITTSISPQQLRTVR